MNKTISKLFYIILIITIFLQKSEETCPVYLTIALMDKSLEESPLEVSWGPGCTEPPQWIGIFRGDPSVSNINPELKIHTENKTSGAFLTDIKIGRIRFPGGWDKRSDTDEPKLFLNGKCLKFYAAGFGSKHNLITLDCLKIQPNWMTSIEHLSSMPLRDIFIPGTYSSGAYYSSIHPKSDLLKHFGYSQYFDVWSQLVFGIRYIDLKIGYDERNILNTGEKLFIINENLLINPFKEVLQDVRRFVLMSGEVVIINLNSLSIGFSKNTERWEEFLNMIDEEIGNITMKHTDYDNDTKSYDLSIDDIKESGKYILILTERSTDLRDDSAIPENEYIWRSWTYFHTGFVNANESLDYMRNVFRTKKIHGWIFEAVTYFESAFNPNKKLLSKQELVGEINSKLGGWLGGAWSLVANVVCVEYFSSTNLIDIAMYTNRQKAFSKGNKELLNFDIVHK